MYFLASKHLFAKGRALQADKLIRQRNAAIGVRDMDSLALGTQSGDPRNLANEITAGNAHLVTKSLVISEQIVCRTVGFCTKHFEKPCSRLQLL